MSLRNMGIPDRVEMSKESDERIAKIIADGMACDSAIKNEGFFKDVFIPMLEDKMDDLRATIEYRPSGKGDTVEAVGANTIWKSGVIAGIEEVFRTINNLRNDRAEAMKIQSEREKIKQKQENKK